MAGQWQIGRNAAPRRRVAASASVEHLEGRQLMAAGATAAAGAGAQVGFQEDGSTGRQVLIITGTDKADLIRIDDNGTVGPGNITVTVGTGNVYTTTTAVSQIDLVAKGGDDQVTYNLDGPLISPRVVLVDLGAGNDKFTDNLNGAINSTNGRDLEVYGDAGNDTMTTNQTGDTLLGNAVVYFEGDAGNDTLTYNGSGTIAQGASFSPEFSGGAGNDTIRSNYTGVDDGYSMYNLTADGGAGNDNITAKAHLLAGSTGSIGSSSGTPAAIQGGTGNDNIDFEADVDPGATEAQVFAIAVGNSGKDTVTRTANVLSDSSNEKTNIVS